MISSKLIGIQLSPRRYHLYTFLWICILLSTLVKCSQSWQHMINLFCEKVAQPTSPNLSVVTSIPPVHELEGSGKSIALNSLALSTIVSTISNSSKKETPPFNSVVIDWLSIGSETRPELLQAHERLYGQSRWIRKVWSATEEDDVDDQCNRILTRDDTLAIANFCQRRRKSTKLSKEARVVVSGQLSHMLLNVTKEPVGWLCAQRRFALGLAKVVRSYQAKSMPLPDYLMIVDDDTYYNIPEFVKFLSNQSSSEHFMIPGAVFPISHRYRFRIYHGGFGLTMSRGALLRAMDPIFCNSLNQPNNRGDQAPISNTSVAENPFCSRLRDNWMGENGVFRNGMSVIDLMHSYASTWEPYSSYKNWTSGFCFHGDWLLTYFLIYAYKVGKRLPPYCRNNCDGWEQGSCFQTSHVCHHVTAQTMEKMVSLW